MSDISQLAIFQYEHAVDFGYIESDETVYEVKETDYLDASKIEVSSKEWIIVDKEGKRPLVVPKRNKDGTYGVDGAIILRCQDPYCLEENCKEKHSFFGFLGTHAPGSYASDAVIRVPQHIEKLHKALRKENIYDEPFIAALEIVFGPYQFGIPPADENIVDIDIKRVERLTTKRK